MKMESILPKGIVANSPGITGAIERMNIEPLDLADITNFWRVYTTTRRRLLDPTAERLESFWWRIWGSQRRQLNGATIAELFANISDSQSFVELRGPANRYEGTPSLNRTTCHGSGAANTTTLHHHSRILTTSSSTTSRIPVVMPHSILKKAQGPSTAGPRPTVRFISPSESEAEAGTTDSPVSQNSHVVVQSLSPDLGNSTRGKKAGKSMVSRLAKKRRAIGRRRTLQSSTDGDTKVDAQISNQLLAETTPPKFLEDLPGKRKTNSKVHKSFSPDRLTVQTKRHSFKQTQKESSEKITSEAVTFGNPVPSRLRSMENEQSLAGNLTHELEEPELQRILLELPIMRVQRISPTPSQRPSNEKNIEDLSVPQISLRATPEGSQELDIAIRLPHDAESTASPALILADAARQIDLGDTIRTPLQQVTGAKRGGRDPDSVKRTEKFTKIPIPPISEQGSPARSKSQLTLLLQKDHARC